MAVLSESQRQRYRDEGFVRLEGAFPRRVALQCRDWLWAHIDESPDDRTTWTRPVVRVFEHGAECFVVAATAPRWVDAILELTGPDAAPTPWMGGTTAIRFPIDGDPGDDGWHVDGSYTGPDGTYWLNHRSRDRALLMLVLFSDVSALDAPTRIRAGSHRLLPDALRPYGEDGVSSFALPLPSAVHDHPLELATGMAGDVYLCHPFLVHAAQRNRGHEPRFIAQPGVPWRPGFDGFRTALLG